MGTKGGTGCPNIWRSILGRSVMKKCVGLLSLLVGFSGWAWATARESNPSDLEVISKTQKMVRDLRIQKMAHQYGLGVMDLTWEDTGRYKNSSVGPNISDMTIQIQHKDTRTEAYSLHCMPVIRYPNFSDRTGDVPLDKFFILVGNERGGPLTKVPLREALSDLRRFLHTPSSWKGKNTSLLAARDTHVLASAQACFLPIPKNGKAEFNPVLFNYQSSRRNPAVLTILATREGTSVTVIDNTRDAFTAGRTWGQRLFFNHNGERANLTGERLSDYISQEGPSSSSSKDPERGMNMVLLIQVPLKQRISPRGSYFAYSEVLYQPCVKSKEGVGRIENAVIGHGKVEGPFTEIDDLDIERDPAFPLRVTVQFYKATEDGSVGEKDVRLIAEQLEKVYTQADYVGSLVVGGDTYRPTEYIGDKIQPSHWWESFWKRHLDNTGETPEKTRRRLYSRPPAPSPRWGLLDD